MPSVTAPFTDALKDRYPNLSDKQRDRLAVAILREMSEAISRGDRIAAFRPQPDGSIDISVFAVVREADDAVL